METEVKILNDSKRRIQKLKIFENFFKQPDLLSIVVRTEIIHSFFEKNKENIDLNKLELFHLQYTDSLSDLLKKICTLKMSNGKKSGVKYHLHVEYKNTN